MLNPSYDLRLCDAELVKELCYKYHGYKSAGKIAVYAFGVFERGKIVAGFMWQPPAPGAAKSVCWQEPQAVLALSRMVAIPKKERELKHISRPLWRQMKFLIDRSRWPVLVTYSDKGQNHNGFTYLCSGWTATSISTNKFYVNPQGERQSIFNCGGSAKGLTLQGKTELQRWEHWAVPAPLVPFSMRIQGWRRVAIPGKTWKSGNPAFKFVKDK